MKKLFRLAVSAIEKKNCLANCLNAVKEAGRRKADLIVLPEEPDLVAEIGSADSSLEAHPVFKKLQAAAKSAQVGLISSLLVKAPQGNANAAFLLDRNGKLIGVYDKKHCAPCEDPIVSLDDAADPFPVYDFEGVKIAMAVCMDIHFPEMFRIYELKQADIVCMSAMYLDYTGDMLESIEKARAIDNSLFFALSRYIDKPFLAGKWMGYAKVIAPDGRIIVSTAHEEGIAVAEFDPKWRFPCWFDGDLLKKYPDFRTMFNKIRRPELYGELTRLSQKDTPKK